MTIKKRDKVGETFASMSSVDLKIDGSTVLDHIDLDIKKGELLAVIGGNGAGKSSILRCLAGVWRPADGTIEINGLDRYDDDFQIREFTAYLPPDATLPSGTIRDNLRLFSEAYRMSEDDYRQNMDSLLRMFDLKKSQDKSSMTLSKGEAKKACLACVMISGADFFILDEPFTDGIDPQGYNALRKVLQKLAENRSITVIFATQILDVAVALADRIAVVNDGRVLAIGTVEELRQFAQLPAIATFDEIFVTLSSKDSQVPIDNFITALEQQNG